MNSPLELRKVKPLGSCPTCGGNGWKYTNWKGRKSHYKKEKDVEIKVDLYGWICDCGEAVLNGNDCRILDRALEMSLEKREDVVGK